MSVINDKITSNKDQERKWLIMANLYTTETLLLGKVYRSKTMEGKIVDVEKHSAWFGMNTKAYLVKIDNPRSINYAYRVVAVGDGE
jgi:hypothetical protein